MTRDRTHNDPMRLLKRVVLPAMAVIIAGSAAYATSFKGTFIFDDKAIVLSREVRDFDVTGFRMGRLLPDLTYAVNYALAEKEPIPPNRPATTARPKPGSYHAVNLAIHLLAGLTLLAIVRRTLRLPVFGGRYDNAADWLAAAIAVLWAVHPLTTQAVTYIVQRDESLMGLMYLLTIYCFIRFSQCAAASAPPSERSPVQSGRAEAAACPAADTGWPFAPSAIRWGVAAIVASALGMASKPVMVTVLAVAPAWHYLFVTRSFGRTLRQTWWVLLPMLALAAGCAYIARTELTPEGGFGKRFAPLDYAALQPGIICHYLKLSLWPAGLSLDYDWPRTPSTEGILIPAAILAALAAAAGVALLRGRRGPAFLAIWFFAILAPTSSIFPLNDPAFEHRMYLPLIAVVAAVVIGAFELATFLSARVRPGPQRAPAGSTRAAAVAMLAMGGIVAVVLSVRTGVRNLDYRSDAHIWKAALDVRPNNARAMTNYGRTFNDKGDVDRAIALFEQAAELRPDYSELWNNLGVAYASTSRKQYDKAMFAYRSAIQASSPRPLPIAHHNIGNVLLRESEGLSGDAAMAKLDQAIASYETAIRAAEELKHRPTPEFHAQLGAALVKRERYAEACRHFELVLGLDAAPAGLHNNYAVALAKTNQPQRAIEHLRKALKQNPADEGAYKNLRKLLELTGQRP